MTGSRNPARPESAGPQREPAPSTPDARTVRKRTRARELALRALYLIDIRGPGARPDVPEFFRENTDDGDVLVFAQELFDGCVDRREELDAVITEVAENWRIGRMAVIDRNILRLGTFELVALEDVPPKVSINEAIDLAKRYSTAESGAFVNGILDKIRTRIRPD